MFELIYHVLFLQNSQKHPNNHILNVGLSSGSWFKYQFSVKNKLKNFVIDNQLNFDNPFTKLIYL